MVYINYNYMSNLNKDIQTNSIIQEMNGLQYNRKKLEEKLLVSNSVDGSVPSMCVTLVNSEKSRKINDPMDLVALAQVVQTADNFTKATVSGKLELISEQIKMLQKQAQQIMEEAHRDVELTHAKCNFQRRPGSIYHLYCKNNNIYKENYFSMIGPNEWKQDPPDQYIGSYRLEYDMSWTKQEDIEKKEAKRNIDPNLLGLQSLKYTNSVKVLTFHL